MYSIIDFNPSTGQILVKFIEVENEVSIDLPIINDMFPEGDELDTYIKGFMPSWIIERKQKLKNVKNTEYFTKFSKHNENFLIKLSEQVRLTRDQALRDCDWIMLPDTGFTEDAVKRFKEYRQKLRDVPQQHGFPFNIEWPSVNGEWPNRKEMN